MERGGGEVKAGFWARLGQGFAWAGMGLLDQIYPPSCPACREPLARDDGLCAECFAQLRPITQPYCKILGIPFESDIGEGGVSLEALAEPPPFVRARAAVQYNEIAQVLVSRLKYGDRTELARFCAVLMVQAGHELWVDRPLLVPVPLHFSRLRARRYNQSYLLAREIGRRVGLEVDPFLARRKRRTRQQVGLSGEGRARNVEGAFATHARALERAKGRSVVLIDDVYTTGATVKALTRAIKRSGIEKVEVLSFARVVIGDDNPI